ncbi:MAG: DNA-primase RepB domain-containing protein [Litorimonas sp.]
MTDPTLTPNLTETLEFLNHINPGFPRRVFTIDPASGKMTAVIFKTEEDQALTAWLLAGAGLLNYYFLPNLPLEGLGPVKPKKRDIEWVTHFWVDVDVTGTSTLEALQKHKPKPSCIIFSGGGFQAFWALETPMQDFTRAERINKALASDLGGDSCHSVDHLMRLPGTINVPNASKTAKGRVPTLAYVVKS